MRLDAVDEIDEIALHGDGHSLLAIARGRLFLLPGLWSGPALQLGMTDGARYSCAGFTNTGRVICAECATNGEWHLVGFDTQRGGHDSPTRVSLRGAEALGEPTELAPSPEGSQVAVATHDLRLLLVEPYKGVATRLDVAEHEGGIFDLAWSADGKWLAYAVSTALGARTSAIRIVHVDRAKPIHVTDGKFRDTSPSWDPAGRYLAFLSSRVLRATEDQIFWQLNFARAQRPYLCMLIDSAADPMRPPPRPPGWEAEDDQDDDEEEPDDEIPEVVVQQAGLAQRLLPVPLPPARLEKLSVLWDDVLIFTQLHHGEDDPSEPPEAAGGGGPEDEGTMMRYDLSSGRVTSLVEGVIEYTLSADLATVCMMVDEGGELSVRAFEAGSKPPEQDDDDEDIDPDRSAERSPFKPRL